MTFLLFRVQEKEESLCVHTTDCYLVALSTEETPPFTRARTHTHRYLNIYINIFRYTHKNKAEAKPSVLLL